MKRSSISSDGHIKTCWYFKQRAFSKSFVQIFNEAYGMPTGFKMRPLRRTVMKKKTAVHFLSTWWIMLSWTEKLYNNKLTQS